MHIGRSAVFLLTMLMAAVAQPPASAQSVSFVTVDRNVRLEVVDWGGTGPPLLFLSGLGNTAHIYDTFAPAFTDRFHAIGLTRRGFGASSRPKSGFGAERLARDVLEAIEALRLDRPVLVGHSIAGEELSFIATRYPSRIRGLVYIDAAYDRTTPAMAAALKAFPPGAPMLESEKGRDGGYEAYQRRTRGYVYPDSEFKQFNDFGDEAPEVPPAILAGVLPVDYKKISMPALALYAMPRNVRHLFPAYDDVAADARPRLDAFWPMYAAAARAEADRFRRDVRRGRAVDIDGRTHYLFLSQQDEVTRLMRAFLSGLVGGS